MAYEALVNKPIFFEKNRVGRVYRGGKLFSAFFGDDSTDGHFPEEWMASAVQSEKCCAPGETQGLSMVLGEPVSFRELIAMHRESMIGSRERFAVLTKVLDSAVRLPVQAHPDKAFSRKYFGSNFGKTEMWLVLDTRENAKVYFGFREGVTKEDFVAAIEKSEQDAGAMPALLEEIPVKPGDVFLIPARTIHAIGAGCLILEAQEPTDFTIEPEAWCDDYHLSETERFMGLDRETAISCFDFTATPEQVRRISRPEAAVLHREPGCLIESLVSDAHTDCFFMNRYTLSAACSGGVVLERAPAVFLVTRGSGELVGPDGYTKPIRKGDYFFLPYCAAGNVTVRTKTEVQLAEVLPPAEG